MADDAVARVQGECVLDLVYNGQIVKGEKFVVLETGAPLMSLGLCKKLRIVPECFPSSVCSVVDSKLLDVEMLDYEPISSDSTDSAALDTTKESDSESMCRAATTQMLQTAGDPSGEHIAKVNAQVMEEFAYVFSENIKRMKGEPFHIELKPNAKPVKQRYPRPVLFALEPKMLEELDTLSEAGVIEKVERYTDWVSPVVCVPRKGSSRVRLCIDFTQLNRAINREFYYSPSPQVSMCDIPKAKARFLSKLDCR